MKKKPHICTNFDIVETHQTLNKINMLKKLINLRIHQENSMIHHFRNARLSPIF